MIGVTVRTFGQTMVKHLRASHVKGINSFASPELNEQLKKKTVGALKPWLVDTNILGKCMLMSSKMVLYVLAHPDMCLNIEKH